MIGEILILSTLVFVLLILFFAGSWLLSFLVPIQFEKGSPLFNSFLKGLVLLIVVTSVYALIQTGFKSIQILSLLLMLILILPYIKRQRGFNKVILGKDSIKQGILLLILSTAMCFLSFLFPLRGLLDSDVGFYTRVAESLSIDRRENYFQFFNEYSSLFNGTSPYHYVELWFSSLIFKLFSFAGFSDFILVKFVMYNFFRCLTVIGIFSLFNSGQLSHWMILLILLFLIPDYSKLVDFTEKDNFFVAPGLFHRPNFVINLVFLVPLLFFLLHDELWGFTLFACQVMLISSVNVPAVCGGLFLFFAFRTFTGKIKLRSAVRYFGFAILIAAGISLFYKFTGLPSQVVFFEPLQPQHLLNEFRGIWKASVFYIGLISAKSLVLLFLAWVLYRETPLHVFLFSFFMLFCGLFVFQLVPTIDNMYQLPYVGYAFLTLVLVYSLTSALQEKIVAKYAGITVICMFLLYKKWEFSYTDFSQPTVAEHELQRQGYSPVFAARLTQYKTKQPSHFGALLSPKDIAGRYAELRHANTYQMGFPLMNIFNNCNILPLTDSTVLFPEGNELTTKDLRKSRHFFRQLNFVKGTVDSRIQALKPEVLICSMDQTLPATLASVHTDSLIDTERFQKLYFISYDKK